MCGRKPNGFNALDCVTRSCKDCGEDKVKQEIEKEPAYKPGQQVVWYRWIFIKKTEGTGRKLILTSVTGKMRQLLDLFISDLRDMSEHIFKADWHYKQFTHLQNHLPKGMVLQVLDFAQNFLCLYQDEPQSCHWDHAQVTLHPIVTYYAGECGHQVTDELMFLTADRKHDSQAVLHFTKLAQQHLTTKVKIDSVVQLTDQCASQYK